MRQARCFLKIPSTAYEWYHRLLDYHRNWDESRNFWTLKYIQPSSWIRSITASAILESSRDSIGVESWITFNQLAFETPLANHQIQISKQRSAPASTFSATAMPQYFFVFAQIHHEFRIPELQSVAEMHGFELGLRVDEDQDPTRPYMVLHLEKEEYALALARRCILVKQAEKYPTISIEGWWYTVSQGSVRVLCTREDIWSITHPKPAK